MDGLTEGRIVHYVLAGKEPFLQNDTRGQHRPALVVNAQAEWAKRKMCNLIVFLDGYEDLVIGGLDDGTPQNGMPSMVIWVPRVQYSSVAEPGTWHWTRDGHET